MNTLERPAINAISRLLDEAEKQLSELVWRHNGECPCSACMARLNIWGAIAHLALAKPPRLGAKP